jgi:soluble lytic murein transglycosylase-like protein
LIKQILKKILSPLCKLVLLACIATMGLYVNITSAAVYVYVLPDGSKLITDKKVRKKGYTLKKSYTTTPFRSGGSNQVYRAAPIKSQYDAMIVSTSLKYNLEPSFIKAVIHVESAFDRYALSKAGAMGLMQLMPATASSYQLNQNHFDPTRNVEAGVQHLKDLMERYDSDKTLSLAAYNAGEGAVGKYQGVPPYEETLNYIEKVMKLYSLYKKEI